MNRSFLPKDPFTRIILGVLLGIFCGLFFGEGAAALKPFGDAYVRLLQMTVLPYVLATLIGGIGRLEPAGAGRLGLRAVPLIVFLWVVSWLTILAIPFAYPAWETGSFFSSSLTAEATSFDPVRLFIPSNIFESLTNTVVPAVVVFSVSLGLALMAMREKHVLLHGLEVLEKAFGRIASFVVKLAPLGIFAIAADAAGTLQFGEIGHLQVYLGTYVAAWAVLAFMTLPMLVAVATPLSYVQVVRHARTAMLTAFAVNTVLVVLPLIAEECKKLLDQAKLANPETESTVDVLVPTAYTLPTAGTPISLAFILFAAWFVGSPLSFDQYPAFAFLGGMSSFGGMYIALPYLLDFFRLPADLFQLFVVGTVATSQLWSSLAAMHGVVICLLAACAVTGRLRWVNLMLAAAVTVVVAAAAFWFLSFAFKGILPEKDIGEKRLLSMRLLQEPVDVTVLTDPAPLSAADRERNRLAVIRERGSLRVGVRRGSLPFVYRNDRDELVGLDMELMHALARDLGASLELVKTDWGDAVRALDTGRIDLLVGGVSITPERALLVAFTRSYIEETPGFLVRDHRRRQFAHMEAIRQIPSLRLGVMPHYFYRGIKHDLPNAELVVVESPKPFLRGELEDVDALVYSAEMGSAWTLMYPKFTVVVPKGLDARIPVGLVVPAAQGEFRTFLNNWLDVNITVGMIEELYQHWILGKGAAGRPPRWSIIRDVLHWVN